METTIQNNICEYLTRLGIGFQSLEHEPIMTMEEGSEITQKLNATRCKSLFLCNKQQQYFMLLLPENKHLSAKSLAQQIGSSHLSFASKEVMERLLSTFPGAVSVLGLINDKDCRVQLLIDEEIASATYIGCHPCVNTCTLKIKLKDILTLLLPAIGHEDYKIVGTIDELCG